MIKFSRFNGLNIRRGSYLEENQNAIEGMVSIKPKIIFKKGINKDEKGNTTIPLVFIGKFIHHIKCYTFEINVTLITDEEKYINNLDKLEVFEDLGNILKDNFNKENSKIKDIINDQIIKLQPYFSNIQNLTEFAID